MPMVPPCQLSPCRPMFPCRMSPYSHADIPFKAPHRNSGCVGVPPIGRVAGSLVQYTNGPNALSAPHYSSGRVEKRVKADAGAKAQTAAAQAARMRPAPPASGPA